MTVTMVASGPSCSADVPATLRVMYTAIDECGFSVLPNVFGDEEVQFLIESISKIEREEGVRTRGGVYAIRNLLHLSPTVNDFACSAKVRSLAEEIQDRALAVRATLFDKTAGANWLVPWHQDLTVCVQSRLDVPG
jgi:hypothetical protein